MPYHWTSIPSSTAPGRRDEIRRACAKGEFAGAQLVSDHVYTDGDGNLFALLKLPDDHGRHGDFLREIRAHPGGIRLTDTDGR
jgi:hypothetical protein